MSDALAERLKELGLQPQPVIAPCRVCGNKAEVNKKGVCGDCQGKGTKPPASVQTAETSDQKPHEIPEDLKGNKLYNRLCQERDRTRARLEGLNAIIGLVEKGLPASDVLNVFEEAKEMHNEDTHNPCTEPNGTPVCGQEMGGTEPKRKRGRPRGCGKRDVHSDNADPGPDYIPGTVSTVQLGSGSSDSQTSR